ncbi:hypothetical protein BC830DRAFT_1170254 [Chytriomyces sp. MP71]|nr:hypothetical protein BC830DRAFT_1170254 [Chytriomyces sp. MP71]
MGLLAFSADWSALQSGTIGISPTSTWHDGCIDTLVYNSATGAVDFLNPSPGSINAIAGSCGDSSDPKDRFARYFGAGMEGGHGPYGSSLSEAVTEYAFKIEGSGYSPATGEAYYFFYRLDAGVGSTVAFKMATLEVNGTDPGLTVPTLKSGPVTLRRYFRDEDCRFIFGVHISHEPCQEVWQQDFCFNQGVTPTGTMFHECFGSWSEAAAALPEDFSVCADTSNLSESDIAACVSEANFVDGNGCLQNLLHTAFTCSQSASPNSALFFETGNPIFHPYPNGCQEGMYYSPDIGCVTSHQKKNIGAHCSDLGDICDQTSVACGDGAKCDVAATEDHIGTCRLTACTQGFSVSDDLLSCKAVSSSTTAKTTATTPSSSLTPSPKPTGGIQLNIHINGVCDSVSFVDVVSNADCMETTPCGTNDFAATGKWIECVQSWELAVTRAEEVMKKDVVYAGITYDAKDCRDASKVNRIWLYANPNNLEHGWWPGNVGECLTFDSWASSIIKEISSSSPQLTVDTIPVKSSSSSSITQSSTSQTSTATSTSSAQPIPSPEPTATPPHNQMSGDYSLEKPFISGPQSLLRKDADPNDSCFDSLFLSKSIISFPFNKMCGDKSFEARISRYFDSDISSSSIIYLAPNQIQIKISPRANSQTNHQAAIDKSGWFRREFEGSGLLMRRDPLSRGLFASRKKADKSLHKATGHGSTEWVFAFTHDAPSTTEPSAPPSSKSTAPPSVAPNTAPGPSPSPTADKVTVASLATSALSHAPGPDPTSVLTSALVQVPPTTATTTASNVVPTTSAAVLLEAPLVKIIEPTAPGAPEPKHDPAKDSCINLLSFDPSGLPVFKNDPAACPGQDTLLGAFSYLFDLSVIRLQWGQWASDESKIMVQVLPAGSRRRDLLTSDPKAWQFIYNGILPSGLSGPSATPTQTGIPWLTAVGSDPAPAPFSATAVPSGPMQTGGRSPPPQTTQDGAGGLPQPQTTQDEGVGRPVFTTSEEDEGQPGGSPSNKLLPPATRTASIGKNFQSSVSTQSSNSDVRGSSVSTRISTAQKLTGMEPVSKALKGRQVRFLPCFFLSLYLFF